MNKHHWITQSRSFYSNSDSVCQIFSKTYQGLQKHPSFEEDDEFVIDSTVGRNVTFQLDFDNSTCNFTDEDDVREEHGDGEDHILYVDIYKDSDRLLRFSFNDDNENDNYRVDVFKFTLPEMIETQLQPGTYGVKVKGGEDEPDCTMTLLITSLAADDEAIPIRYLKFK